MSPEGYLVATGPALQDDLTEMDYELTVEGSPWTGVLFVPRGGTQAAEADAKADSAAIAGLTQTTGPNGGQIQVIGGERYEVVADRNTQEMRMYLLGPSYEVVDPGERVIRMGYVTTYPETLVLVREPGANYYVAPFRSYWDPVQVSIGVGFGGGFHYGILGWGYGGSVRFGVRAPRGAARARRAGMDAVGRVRRGRGLRASASRRRCGRRRRGQHERADRGVEGRAYGHGDVGGRAYGHGDGDDHGDGNGHGDGDDHGHGDRDDHRGHGDRDDHGHGDDREARGHG